jgi:hypothetical protein
LARPELVRCGSHRLCNFVAPDGRSRKVSKQRALIKSLMAKALQGDVRASAALLALYARIIAEAPEDQNESIDTEEMQILRRFAPRLLKAIVSK